MKHLNRYIFLAILTMVAAGCMNEDEIIPVDGETGVKMTFTATIEEGEDTKTILGESDEHGHRKLLWAPEDSIGIVDNDWSEIRKFVNTKPETDVNGVFEGSLNRTYSTYYAVYPYKNTFGYDWSNGIKLEIPANQKYAEGTFAPDMNVMVARAESGTEFNFKNLCGILIINLTGNETVKSISFSAKDETGASAKISGEFYVKMDYVEAPVLTATETSNSIISLDCGEGIELKADEATPFYLVVPPGTYSDIMVTIGTTDGQVMLKKGTNPLNITRAQYISAGTLEYAAEISIDLSNKGTANCYIISEPGVYSFDASTIGNGEFGLTNASVPYHTTDATIMPHSAELLWSDGKGSVGGVAYDSKSHRINFVATGAEGNAVIAAKDAEGTILWSWHIWSTDKPSEHLYVNSYGSFTVLDRNIGATRTDAGTGIEYMDAVGMMYQKGRKDPFYGSLVRENDDWTEYKNHYKKIRGQFSIAESIKLPDTFVYGNSNWSTTESVNQGWSDSDKSIYDPCPVGYRVAKTEVWAGFTKDGNSTKVKEDIMFAGEWNNGTLFYYDGVNTAWYPTTPIINEWDGNLNYNEYHKKEGHLWVINESTYLTYKFESDYNCYFNRSEWGNIGRGLPVRCMKDEATASMIIKMYNMEDVGSTRATAVGKIATYGEMGVIKSGFVVGSASDVNIYSGTVYETTNTTGQISAEIIGLEPLNRYYIRAFATTSESTVYSEAVSFFTPNNEGIINLSVGGSANCYIVKPVYSTYTFDMVKGNSNESVGSAVAAEVLWETYNTSDAVTQNSVIASVSIDGDKVKFTMPENAVPGNAVIAVKDSEGTILWSWHIWVVDFDPETTKQTYLSGAVMMDRNLGALNIADNDSRSYGLLYQWGRKDPFTAPVSDWNFASTYPSDIRSHAEKITDYNYSIQNPTVSLPGTDWNSDNTLWSSSKTIYDPCPAGWRVPDGGPGVWANIDSRTWNGWYNLASIETKDSPAYYPTGGYADGYGQNIHDYGNWSRLYSCTPRQESDIWTFAIGDGWSNGESTSRDYHLSVRCMKDEPPFDNGSNEGYGESDDYEW